MSQKPQSFENHARYVPALHFVAIPLLVVNFFYLLYMTVAAFSWGNLVALGTAIALVILSFAARVMALTVQDRVIRLEERLRMRALLPPDLQGRIDEFSIAQLVALRFACDAELPALARKVLDDGIQSRKDIKRMVSSWRADYLRA